MCWFAYRSPWPLSHRDCLYAKYRTNSSTFEESERERAVCTCLSYWTIDDADIKAHVKEYVRIDFEAFHYIAILKKRKEERKKGEKGEGEGEGEKGEVEGEKGEGEGEEEYVEYGCLQWSDPKLPLPSFLLESAQIDILIHEVTGLRKAVALRECSS